MKHGSVVLLVALAAALVGAIPAAAHDLGALQVAFSWSANGRLEVDIRIDGEHLTPGLVPPDVPWAERGRIACGLARDGSILSEGGRTISLRERQQGVVNDPPHSPYWHTLLEADLPPGARELVYTQRAKVGQYTVLSEKIEGANAALRWSQGGGDAAVPVTVPIGTNPPARSTAEIVFQYLRLGFHHILPEGLDHVCFVLGLFLLALRLRPLLVQVTCFTVAHTISLGLATLELVRLPPSVVEPLIALSIAYVGIENLVTKEMRPWRPALVFGFGLLHGLGFAGVLASVGISRRELVPALLSFNLGVEGGQLAVLSAAFLLVGLPFGKQPWYQARIAIPGSLAVAGLGLFWFVQRLS